MAEILHFEILRKHGQTNTHTNKQTRRHGHYNTSPSPYGGRGNNDFYFKMATNFQNGHQIPIDAAHYTKI